MMLLAATDWVAFSSVVGLVAAGVATGIATLIIRLSPAIGQAIRDIGPAVVDYQFKYGKKVIDNTTRIVELERDRDAFKDREANLGNLVNIQREEMTRLALQNASLSTAFAAKLGLISPMADPADFDRPGEIENDAHRAVLIVEDDPATARAYTALLRAKGFKTAVARDPATAISMLAQGPTVVLLDLMLAGGDGEQVLKEAQGTNNPARVIVTTGIENPVRLREIEALKPYTIFRKPVNYPAMLAAIRGESPTTSAPFKAPLSATPDIL